MEFLIQSMSTEHFISIKKTLPTQNKKGVMDEFLHLTIFYDAGKCVINNQSDAVFIISEYTFPIVAISNNIPLCTYETTPTIKNDISFFVSSVLLTSIINNIETHDIKISVCEGKLTLTTMDATGDLQGDLFPNKDAQTTCETDIKFSIPTTSKAKPLAKITVHGNTLHNHLRHLSQIHPTNSKKSNDTTIQNENIAYIQCSIKLQRLIFYSAYQNSLSTSAFNFTCVTVPDDFFLGISKKIIIKLLTLIKVQEQVEITLIAEQSTTNTEDLPDTLSETKAHTYYLKISHKEICFSFDVEYIENEHAIVNQFKNSIGKNLKIENEFNSEQWFKMFQKNRLSNGKETAVELIFDQLSPKKVKLIFYYDQNASHVKTSTQASEIESPMPFSNSLNFKLNLATFYCATKTLFDLSGSNQYKGPNTYAQTSISSQENDCDAILLQCHLHNKLKERFFVLIPFE